MKRWMTTQQMANDIALMDVSNNEELNISQCNAIAKNIKNLYKAKGKSEMITHLRGTLPSCHMNNGLTMDQKDRVMKVVNKLFFWDFIPFSRIRNNMVRIKAVK